MTEAYWLRELNLYMDHNDNWTRAELAHFIFVTQKKLLNYDLDYLNEGHPDGPWKESDEKNLRRT